MNRPTKENVSRDTRLENRKIELFWYFHEHLRKMSIFLYWCESTADKDSEKVSYSIHITKHIIVIIQQLHIWRIQFCHTQVKNGHCQSKSLVLRVCQLLWLHLVTKEDLRPTPSLTTTIPSTCVQEAVLYIQLLLPTTLPHLHPQI